MTVPNGDRAFVSPEKLATYLLALTHPVGGSKARFFRAHGFDESNSDELAAGLCTIARGMVSAVRHSSFGVKYTVVGELLAPRGTTLVVETVWIIEPHDGRPRLVTAYPTGDNRPQDP